MSWLNSECKTQRPSCTQEASQKPEHLPVMVIEVLKILECKKGQIFVDLTIGGGGHAQAILEATSSTGFLGGADRDRTAIERTASRLKSFGGRFRLIHDSLSNVEGILSILNLSRIDGVLIDCGLSSHQLNDLERGFSFKSQSSLDMRMDQSQGKTAMQWLAKISENELSGIIFRYGEDRYGRRIAKAIVRARNTRRLKTAFDLAQVIRSAVPFQGGPRAINPATRTFQAIRIVLNRELEELEVGISALLRILPSHAKIVVITFHSLEDRIVKNLFKNGEKSLVGRVLLKKPLRPTGEEIFRNPRSRSAKLRAFEVLR